MMPADISIIPATPAHYEEVRALFREYEEFLQVDLCFQGFDEELASLPGKYAPEQRGALLLAKRNDAAVGVVGLRDLGDSIAEMKRLYIEPAGRGHNFGRALTDAVLAEARRFGYRAVRLDTFPSMVAANRIYDSLGFVDIPPYYDNPLPGARYRELKL